MLLERKGLPAPCTTAQDTHTDAETHLRRRPFLALRLSPTRHPSPRQAPRVTLRQRSSLGGAVRHQCESAQHRTFLALPATENPAPGRHGGQARAQRQSREDHSQSRLFSASAAPNSPGVQGSRLLALWLQGTQCRGLRFTPLTHYWKPASTAIINET